jgi:hypothetical protein
MVSRRLGSWTTAVVLAVVGCDKPAEAAPVEPAPDATTPSPADPEAEARDPGAWWRAQRPCPDGARLLGAAPPEGSRIWCETSEGVSDGPLTVWYPSGTKKADGRWRADEQDGPWTTWYPDGTRKTQGTYDAGAMVGVWTSWGPDGNRTTEVVHGGHGETYYRSWRPVGTVQQEGTYLDGREHGTWTRWSPDGNVATRRTYDHGEPITPEPYPVVGVPVCDGFVSRYLRCVHLQLQPEQREQAREAMRASVDRWLGAQDESAIAEQCEQAQAEVRGELGESSCEL